MSRKIAGWIIESGDEPGSIRAMRESDRKALWIAGRQLGGAGESMLALLTDLLNEAAPEPATVAMTDQMRDFITGMAVSVDAGIDGENGQEHRYFGTVKEVMDDAGSRHGVILLVHDVESSCKPTTVAVDAGALAELLEQAAEDIQEWGAYASVYFQEKHNLSANVAKYREASRRLLAGGEL